MAFHPERACRSAADLPSSMIFVPLACSCDNALLPWLVSYSELHSNDQICPRNRPSSGEIQCFRLNDSTFKNLRYLITQLVFLFLSLLFHPIRDLFQIIDHRSHQRCYFFLFILGRNPISSSNCALGLHTIARRYSCAGLLYTFSIQT